MFGIASGPFVWGRVAAALMRAGQSVVADTGSLSCFVDDPILAAKGLAEEPLKNQLRVALLWTALGFRMAWAKCQQGTTVNWIGAKLVVGFNGKDGTSDHCRR